jgi:flavin reductase (DIM6/NTAB) family NADH-FMN oxidoreductase RutF
MTESAINSTRNLRQALGTFATGVTVVTTMDEAGEPRGFTANSFTSVSLQPPLLLVCLAKSAATCPVFTAGQYFCVNILTGRQQDICQLFASPVRNRFEQIDWHAGRHGCPVIDNVVSWFECDSHEVVDAGDHVILLGRILEHEFSGRSPLVYCSGAYVEFSMLQRAMEGAGHDTSTRISAVINCQDSILLRREDDKWSLPSAKRLGNEKDTPSLTGMLAANGMHVDIPFICAVYEDHKSNTHNVVYRGTADLFDASLLRDFELVRFDRIPWEKLVDDPLRMLLRRYLEEHERDAFGVYVGDTEQGEVRSLRLTH